MINIAIIDSDVDVNHPKLAHHEFKGVSISLENGEIKINNDISDEVGHGTAIAGIIFNSNLNVNIYMIKIFVTAELTVEPEVLLAALKYVYENVDCQFILMSLGATVLDDIEPLKQICDRITQKGTVIISAFDNLGCLSYPACLKNVIGVDSVDYIKNNDEYEVIEGDGVIDLRAKGGIQRVCWVNPKYRLVTGTSFAAAHALTHIVRAYEEGARGKDEILKHLRTNAKRIVTFNKRMFCDNEMFLNSIKIIAVYPYNKEIQTMVRYSELMPYKITHICDEPLHGCVGNDVDKELFGIRKNERIIESINDIWSCNDFDTVIIGHLEELSLITNTDLLKKVLELCLEHHKNAYSFDDINPYKEIVATALCKNLIFSSPTCNTQFPIGHLGRLWKSSKPVIGVFGTSSRQGKFSLQLLLRQVFLEKGYQVSQLGTEPSSLLMGLEKMYPMGYHANLPFRNEESVIMLNEIVHQMELQNPDVIIVGGQSCTIPYDVNHIYDLTFSQWDLVMGTNPDLFVLCVNPQDPYEYITRTIHFLECVGHGKVVGLVLFPVQLEQEWHGFAFKNTKLSEEDYNLCRKNISTAIGLPVYALNVCDVNKLVDQIIEILST